MASHDRYLSKSGTTCHRHYRRAKLSGNGGSAAGILVSLSPMSPVIDMSAYDLPLPAFPAPENYSESSLLLLPLAAMSEDNPNPAALVRQPAPNRSAQPECILFPSFDKRVNNR